MAQLGADPEQLRRLAGTLRSSARRMDDVALGLSRRVRSTGWHGTDADRFEREWQIRHRPALLASSEQCSALARTLDRQVAEQLRVSSVGSHPTVPARAEAPGSGPPVLAPFPTSEVRYDGGVALHGAVVTAGVEGELTIQQLGRGRARVVVAEVAGVGAAAAVGASASVSLGDESYSSSPVAGASARVGASVGVMQRRTWEVSEDEVDDLLLRVAVEKAAEHTVHHPNPLALAGSVIDSGLRNLVGVDPNLDDLAAQLVGTPTPTRREVLAEVELAGRAGLGAAVGVAGHLADSATIRAGRGSTADGGSTVVEVAGSGSAGFSASLARRLGIPLDAATDGAGSIRLEMPDPSDGPSRAPTLISFTSQSDGSLDETVVGIDLADPRLAPAQIQLSRAVEELRAGDLEAARAAVEAIDVPDGVMSVASSTATVTGTSAVGGAEVSGGIGAAVSAKGRRLEVERSAG